MRSPLKPKRRASSSSPADSTTTPVADRRGLTIMLSMVNTEGTVGSHTSLLTETDGKTVLGDHGNAWGRTWLLVSLASVLVGLTLRVGIVVTRNLWADEAFTWRVTSVSFGQMLHRLETDFHPPLHYLLMWLLQLIFPVGSGPTYLRLANLSWFAGLGAIAMWSSRRPPLRVAMVPAFAVVAVSPGFVGPGAELRMYGMLLMMVSLLLVAVTKIVERPTWSAVIVGAMAAAAASWTQYAGVVAAGSIITAGFFRGGRKRFAALLPVATIFAAGVIALIPFMLLQFGHGIGYKIGIVRLVGSILDDFSVLGLTLCVAATGFFVYGLGRRGASISKPKLCNVAVIALIAVLLFVCGMLSWYVVKGQNAVNEGVSTIPVYLLLVGILGLRIIPARTVVIIALVVGLATALCSIVDLWGAPKFSLGKRVSNVDVLDAAIRQDPTLAAQGGRGWLIVEVDWADMNYYFRSEARKRLPEATVAVGTPANRVVLAKINRTRAAYQKILVIRRPGTGVIGAIKGYKLSMTNRWTAIYRAEN